MLTYNDPRTVQFIHDPSGLFNPKSVEVSRLSMDNPRDSRRVTSMAVVSDPVSGMQSTYAEEPPDCTNNVIVGDAGPTRDSVSTAQIFAMLRESWETERTFPCGGGVSFFFDD